MIAPTANALFSSRWDARHAATLTPPELLVCRSNLLGSDLRITIGSPSRPRSGAGRGGAACRVAPDEHDRKRSLLKRDVLPEDVGEAIYFLVSDLSAKSTGNIINVDAGNTVSFTRQENVRDACPKGQSIGI